uniref:Putative propionate kinase n=1 Tax=Lygus hesperus TaxID=30085 RepID=A0A0A9VNN8_LYGHE
MYHCGHGAALLARVYGGSSSTSSSFTPGSSVQPTYYTSPLASSTSPAGTHHLLRGKKQREGSLFALANTVYNNEKTLRKQLNEFLAEERDPLQEVRAALDGGLKGAQVCGAYPQKKLVNLPGVERVRDLPADPITRLFFQHKGEHALYYGSFDHPSEQDTDRVQIASRVRAHRFYHNIPPPMYDFCNRIREACEQRKRFVIVPATLETKGCA